MIGVTAGTKIVEERIKLQLLLLTSAIQICSNEREEEVCGLQGICNSESIYLELFLNLKVFFF